MTSKNGDSNENKEDTNGSSSGIKASDPSNFVLGLPGSQTGGKKLAIIFTCSVCNTRAAKQFTEQAYKNGVVLVQCPGCGNRHLIADNLGIFGDEVGGWTIEKAMAKLGQEVTTVTNDNVLELTVDQIIGPEKLKEIEKSEKEKESHGAGDDPAPGAKTKD